MPISPRLIVSTAALLAAFGLAGCTTSGIDVGAEMQAAKDETSVTDPDTPEVVAEAEGVADGEQLQAAAVAAPAGGATASAPEPVAVAAASANPPVQVSSYAGPTPTSAADAVFAPEGRFGPTKVEARSPELDALIARYANHYQVPEELVRRVVKRESTFNPAARNGPYWGLMQILPATARSMGHDGPASELLDAETNLKYAVRYLRGAYITAGGNHDQAVRLYARGYYYDAKAKGLLEETGLRGPRKRMAEAAPVVAAAEPEPEAVAPQPQVLAKSAARAIQAVAAPTEPQAGN